MKGNISNRGAKEGNTNACTKGKFATSDSNYCNGVEQDEKELEEFLNYHEEYKKTIDKQALLEDYKQEMIGEAESTVDAWPDYFLENEEFENYTEDQKLYLLYEEYLNDKGMYYGNGPLALWESNFDSGPLSEDNELFDLLEGLDEEKGAIESEAYNIAYNALGETKMMKKARKIYNKYSDFEDIPSEEDEDEDEE